MEDFVVESQITTYETGTLLATQSFHRPIEQGIVLGQRGLQLRTGTQK
jgi:hypothetical protein